MSITALSNVKDTDEPEKFVDVTLRVTALWDPHEVDFVQSPAKAEQCGLFEGEDGDTIRFVSWTNSDPPQVEEGKTYELSDLYLVYGRNGDEFKSIFRSKTDATEVATESNSTGGGSGECPSCGESLSKEDYNEGPGAPSVGWEYYTCPGCKQNLRPEVV